MTKSIQLLYDTVALMRLTDNILFTSMSEFEAMVVDLKATLDDILDFEDYMAEMYLSHLAQHKWVGLCLLWAGLDDAA